MVAMDGDRSKTKWPCERQEWQWTPPLELKWPTSILIGFLRVFPSIPNPPETPVTTVATGHPAPTKVATVCIKQFTLQYGAPRALGGYCRQAFHVGPPSKPPINIQISPTPV